jgi:hypothetical protein
VFTEDIEFKLLDSDQIVTSSLNKLISNKRVLFCSISSPHSKLTHAYLKELVQCQERYKEYGIDKICLIDSSNDFWSLPIVQSFFPKLTIFLDYDRTLINYLKKIFLKSESVEFLVNNWRYQLLLNDKKIETFYEQPTENRAEELKKYLMKQQFIKLKENKKEELLPGFSLPKFLKQSEELIFNSIDAIGSQSIAAKLPKKTIFYYNIWPNLELEKYLKKETNL